MIIIWCSFFLFAFVQANDSSIFVDWSRSIQYPHQVRQFTIHYNPAVGHPPTHSVFPSSIQSLAINRTVPAVDYHVNVSALLTDNRRVPVLSTVITSSPPRPILEFLKAQSDEVTFAFLVPKIPDLTYYIEYFDVDHESGVNFIETNKTALRIRQLEPNTLYKLRVYSLYRGIPSTEALESEFKTRASAESSTSLFVPEALQNAIKLSKNQTAFTDTTQLAQSTIHRKPVRPFAMQTSGNYGNFVTATVTMMPLPASVTPDRPFYNSDNDHKPLPHWKQPEKFNKSHSHLSELPPLELLGEVAASLFTSTEHVPITQAMQTSTASPIQVLHTISVMPEEQTIIKPTRIVNLSKSAKSTTTQKPVEFSITKEIIHKAQKFIEEIEVDEMPTTSEQPAAESTKTTEEDESTPPISETFNIPNANEELDTFETKITATNESESFNDNGKPEIRTSKEGNQIRLEWDQPEKALCDNYLVNTTLLNAHKSLSTASANTYAYVKFYQNEQLIINISCMSEGAVSSVWSAEKFLDLNKPKPVENLQVKSIYTDEFYVATITLDIDWPLDYDSDQYEIVVVYALGKKAIGTNKATFNERGEMVIGKLEAAKLYTFAVRNVSKDLGIASAPIGIRQIMPPVITSTLSPGQISSYAININFEDSEREHPFESYELTFVGNARNITKKLSKTDPKSFTFNKLVPGKTYTFILYTIYKNVKSRPVISEVTTYPLKVKSFYPVVGPGYVSLHWTIENVADSNCRFRLEYSSTSNSGIQKSQKVILKDTNKHRFSGLDYDTYYTFTIIVLMGVGKAEAESESEMITVGFKGKPNSLPILQRRGIRELQLTVTLIKFENDPNIFSDTNGVVDNFAIIVAEDITLGGDDYELKNYYEIKDEPKWPAYRASNSTYNPFKHRGSSRAAVFLIGDEECDRRKLTEPFCNGVLKARVDYFVKVRAYLVTNFAMETEWVSVKGRVDDNSEGSGENKISVASPIFCI
ncbi:hypothetical protein M3Y97_00555700 [Aphelenchoides bicaudatus]|nr:hypothetical protein M3Y97_00555700 [Aphelenchoides bicaudatus]